MALEQPRTLTYADYAALPDDGRRFELIDGELFEMNAPTTRHQRIVVRLCLAFGEHVRREGVGEVFVAPCDVVLADTVTVQPDVVYLSEADVRKVTAPNIQGPPTLVAEVLSDPRHDLVRKRELYARFGIAEYWIVWSRRRFGSRSTASAQARPTPSRSSSSQERPSSPTSYPAWRSTSASCLPPRPS